MKEYVNTEKLVAMEITVEEAIAELEKRKEFLTAQCDDCWDPAMEMALQALKALNIDKVTDARSAAEYEIPDRIDIPELEFKEEFKDDTE